jgi:hypothetical protein
MGLADGQCGRLIRLDPFAQGLRRAEHHAPACRDIDRFAGARMTPAARGHRAQTECTEAMQAYGTIAYETIPDRGDQRAGGGLQAFFTGAIVRGDRTRDLSIEHASVHRGRSRIAARSPSAGRKVI